PGADSQEIRYLDARRKELGGYLPVRTVSSSRLAVPPLQVAPRNQSTTMVFVQLLAQLMKDEALGARVVPIVADEARTFGMQTLFRQFGIYSALGQLYEPEDHEELLYYREAKDGQILEEGITEAGALSSWLAAATSYSSHGMPMLPFYIYYSIFGFQRVGDLIWAAADARRRRGRHPERDVSIQENRKFQTAVARLGGHPARSNSRGRAAGEGLGHSSRGLERHFVHRAAARRHAGRARAALRWLRRELGGRMPVENPGCGGRRKRLRQRGGGPHPALRAAQVRGPGDRWLRPQRY